MSTQWLEFARRITAIAQIGLRYAENPYDIERYEQLRDLAIEMTHTYTEDSPELLHKLFASEPDYPTPKVDTRGVVFKDRKILLVKEKMDGLWTLPGGWADIGDSPSEAVEREIHEESGYVAKAVKLLAIYDRSRHDHPPHPFYIYKLIFLCELLGGEGKMNHETEAIEWFSEDKIPPLSIARVTEKQIARFFDHYRNKDWPTDFD